MMPTCGFIAAEHMRMFLGFNGVVPRKPGRPRKQGKEEVINESVSVMGVD